MSCKLCTIFLLLWVHSERHYQINFPLFPYSGAEKGQKGPVGLRFWPSWFLLGARASRQGKQDAPQEKVDFLRPKSGEGRVGKLQSGGSHCSFFQFVTVEVSGLGWADDYKDASRGPGGSGTGLNYQAATEKVKMSGKLPSFGFGQRVPSQKSFSWFSWTDGDWLLEENKQTDYFRRKKTCLRKTHRLCSFKIYPQADKQEIMSHKNCSPHSLLRKQYFRRHHMKLLD